jgi:hypothetical protein
MLSSRVCQIAKKTAPLEGAIHLAASLRSHVGVVVMVMVMMMMEFVLMMLNIRLRTWDRADRERNGADGGQNESKFSHLKYSSPSFLSDQKMAKASAHVKWIFMNGRSGTSVHGWTRARTTDCCGALATESRSLRLDRRKRTIGLEGPVDGRRKCRLPMFPLVGSPPR